MCKLNKVSIINSNDDVQTVIIRTILQQTDSFYYTEILKKIKEELSLRGASSRLVNSFRVERMIQETLDSLTNSERLYCFNNHYTPLLNVHIHKQIKHGF